MDKTRRVSLKSGEKYDVYCGRPSIYGNPYSHKTDTKYAKHIVHTRAESIQKFKEYLYSNKELQKEILKLKGKTLACWCSEDKSCHVDVIIEFLETNKLF